MNREIKRAGVINEISPFIAAAADLASRVFIGR